VGYGDLPYLHPGDTNSLTVHKEEPMPHNTPKPQALVSLRTMVITAVSITVGIGAGGLTYWYASPGHHAAAVIAAIVAFAASVKFLNDIIATGDTE
jgi:hypothetical protein